MKIIKYLLFGLVCLFSCNIVFATNEITVDSMIPVYDENSGVIVTEENGEHSVIFNDKDQSVEYNVVLKNNTNKDIPMENLSLPKPTEDFLKYELTGLNSGDVIKANSTKDVVISLETIKTEGWGRNFNMELTTVLNYERAIENPHTGASIIAMIVGLIILLLILFVLLRKQKRLFCSLCLLGILVLNVQNINAQEIFYVPIKLKVGFESQNVMSKSGAINIVCIYEEPCYDNSDYKAFWKYSTLIRNIYIENNLSEPPKYAYKFDVSEKQNGKVVAYLVTNENDSTCYDLFLQADGIIYANSDASYYFTDMVKLEKINNLEGLDTSNVTNMRSMFAYAGYNNPTFTLDVSDLDTSNVTDMSNIFYSAGYNSANFTLDISNLDTSKVTNMSCMFCSTGYNDPTFTLDVSNFDTSNVTNMSSMFSCAGYNNPTFTLDVSNFDTSNVTDMMGMFSSTGKSSTTFTLDLSNFDTSNVTNMSSMFYETGYSNPTFTLDLSSFDTSNVTDMALMFHSTGYNDPTFTLDVSNFDTSNVTNMSAMFYETGYNSTVFTLDVSDFDTSNVTYMVNMFSGTGYASTRLNTTITIRNPNITIYGSIFSRVATKTGSQITVNYTSETSELVDKMIATKSSNSNVVKGVQVD